MRIKIDYLANNSPLQKVHPLEKLLFALICLLAVLTASGSTVQTFIFLAVSIVIVYIGRIAVLTYVKLLLIPAGFISLSLLGIVLGEVPLAESLLLAYSYFSKALAGTACMYFLVLTTSITDLLATLSKLGVPQLLLELMSLTYHFIFVLLEVASEITTAQEARLGYNSPKVALKSLSLLISQLLVRTIHRSQQLQQTLEARCYSGKLEVFSELASPSIANLVLLSILGFALITINLVGVGKL